MRSPDATTVLVTGATDGIGKATARRLAEEGAHVILHGRTQAKVDRTAEELRALTGNRRIDGVTFDLGSLQAVRDGAARVLERFPAIHVLVNNAGVYMNECRATVDGYETTFAVNHLAPFLLTELLLPALRRGAPARIVNVSSIAHNRGTIRLDDLDLDRGWGGYGAYAQSKLANVLHANALARRLQGTGITANSLHPGVIATKLLRDGFGMNGGGHVDDGAETSVYLALSPEVEGVTGKYFDDCREVPAQPAARDVTLQDALWEASVRRAGPG